MIHSPHIIHTSMHTDARIPCIPLLAIRPAELHPLPVSSYGVALLLDETFSAAGLAALDILIRGQRPFLLIPGPGLQSQQFEYLIHCLFSPAYIRQGGEPVLLFPSAPPAGLIPFLQRQGYSDIVQWNISRIPRLSQSYGAGEAIDAWLASQALGKFLLVQGSDLDDTLSLEQDLRREFIDRMNDQPSLRMLVQQKLELQQQLDQQREDNRILRERLQNAETTVNVVRHKYKDDYDILFNWYQEQYEVLPLWYKRVGHIIKVLTGKRSFKSLAGSVHRKIHRWKASRRRTPPKNTDI